MDNLEKLLEREEKQEKAAEDIYSTIPYENVILLADMGFGKTFVTFKLIDKMKKTYGEYKTLVISPAKDLNKKWHDDADKYGLKSWNIVNWDKSIKSEWKNYDLIIMTPEMVKTHIEEIEEYIEPNLIVIDEVDKISAKREPFGHRFRPNKSYKPIIDFANKKDIRILGLSAYAGREINDFIEIENLLNAEILNIGSGYKKKRFIYEVINDEDATQLLLIIGEKIKHLYKEINNIIYYGSKDRLLNDSLRAFSDLKNMGNVDIPSEYKEGYSLMKYLASFWGYTMLTIKIKGLYSTYEVYSTANELYKMGMLDKELLDKIKQIKENKKYFSKMEWVKNKIKDAIKNNERIIVYSHHRVPLKNLIKKLEEEEIELNPNAENIYDLYDPVTMKMKSASLMDKVAYISGNTPDINEQIEEYNNGKKSIILATLGVGGRGINLFGTDEVIFTDGIGNLVEISEALGRARDENVQPIMLQYKKREVFDKFMAELDKILIKVSKYAI